MASKSNFDMNLLETMHFWSPIKGIYVYKQFFKQTLFSAGSVFLIVLHLPSMDEIKIL